MRGVHVRMCAPTTGYVRGASLLDTGLAGWERRMKVHGTQGQLNTAHA